MSLLLRSNFHQIALRSVDTGTLRDVYHVTTIARAAKKEALEMKTYLDKSLGLIPSHDSVEPPISVNIKEMTEALFQFKGILNDMQDLLIENETLLPQILSSNTQLIMSCKMVIELSDPSKFNSDQLYGVLMPYERFETDLNKRYEKFCVLKEKYSQTERMWKPSFLINPKYDAKGQQLRENLSNAADMYAAASKKISEVVIQIAEKEALEKRAIDVVNTTNNEYESIKRQLDMATKALETMHLRRTEKLTEVNEFAKSILESDQKNQLTELIKMQQGELKELRHRITKLNQVIVDEEVKATFGKHFVYIVDRSASMNGKRWKQASDKYKEMRRNLLISHPDAVVTLIVFNTQATLVFERQPVSQTPETLEDRDMKNNSVSKVWNHIKDKWGGTDFAPPLALLDKVAGSTKTSENIVAFFITDGEASTFSASHIAGGIRVKFANRFAMFCIGIDCDGITSLRELAFAANGSSSMVVDGQEIYQYVSHEWESLQLFVHLFKAYDQCHTDLRNKLRIVQEVYDNTEERHKIELDSLTSTSEKLHETISAISNQRIEIEKKKMDHCISDAERACERAKVRQSVVGESLDRARTSLSKLQSELRYLKMTEEQLIQELSSAARVIKNAREALSAHIENEQVLCHPGVQLGMDPTKLAEFVKLTVSITETKDKIRECISQMSAQHYKLSTSIRDVLFYVTTIKSGNSIPFDEVLGVLKLYYEQTSDEGKAFLGFSGSCWHSDEECIEKLLQYKFRLVKPMQQSTLHNIISHAGLPMALDPTDQNEEELIRKVISVVQNGIKAEFSDVMFEFNELKSDLDPLLSKKKLLNDEIMKLELILDPKKVEEICSKLSTLVEEQEKLQKEINSIKRLIPSVKIKDPSKLPELEDKRKELEALLSSLSDEEESLLMQHESINGDRTPEELAVLREDLQNKKTTVEEINTKIGVLEADISKWEPEVRRMKVNQDNIAMSIATLLPKIRKQINDDLRLVKVDELRGMFIIMWLKLQSTVDFPIKCLLRDNAEQEIDNIQAAQNELQLKKIESDKNVKMITGNVDIAEDIE